MKSWLFQAATLGSMIAMEGCRPLRENGGFQFGVTSPRNGDILVSTFEPTYALGKGTKGDHVYGFVDGQYQKGFEGTLHRLKPGKHQIMVTVADHDHSLLATLDSIESAVK